MPLAITRQQFNSTHSETIDEARNQVVRSRPQNRDSGHDAAVAPFKGRENMAPAMLIGNRLPFQTPPTGWHVLQAREGDLAKVAGRNLDPDSRRAAVTGTSEPEKIVGAASLDRNVGVVVIGRPVGDPDGGAPRVKALNAMPRHRDAPVQLAVIVDGMRQDRLYVQAAMAGGRPGDEGSESMVAALGAALQDRAVPIVLDDTLQDRSLGVTDPTVVAVVRDNGDVRIGNHVHIA